MKDMTQGSGVISPVTASRKPWEARYAMLHRQTGGGATAENRTLQTPEGRRMALEAMAFTPSVPSECTTDYSGVSERIRRLSIA